LGGSEFKDMLPIETEVKFHLPDPSAVRTRLLAWGARSMGRSLERNIRFEDAGKNLIRRKSLLRLREDRRVTLAFKSVLPEADPAFKQLIELEVEVADFAAMQRILASLGYHPEQTYEKWRETLALDQTTYCLDTLPFGDFLEIEGTKEAILSAAKRLGLDWHKRILLNYLQIFDVIRNRESLTFADVTFSNFATQPVRVGTMLHLLVADAPQGPDG
jgi:adenylate cyclase class 2